jgi:hypothetical protein
MDATYCPPLITTSLLAVFLLMLGATHWCATCNISLICGSSIWKGWTRNLALLGDVASSSPMMPGPHLPLLLCLGLEVVGWEGRRNVRCQ